jgi:hypothetical protein
MTWNTSRLLSGERPGSGLSAGESSVQNRRHAGRKPFRKSLKVTALLDYSDKIPAAGRFYSACGPEGPIKLSSREPRSAAVVLVKKCSGRDIKVVRKIIFLPNFGS